MTAYSFKKQFAPPILDGSKVGTIRADRRNGHARPGTTLQLYSAMRTKHCRHIADKTCTAVLPIALAFKHNAIAISVAGVSRPVADLEAFARADGFETFETMRAFWPADGVHNMSWILWQPVRVLYERGIVVRDEEEIAAAAQAAPAEDAEPTSAARAQDLWAG